MKSITSALSKRITRYSQLNHLSKRFNNLGHFTLPAVENEKFLNYAPGSPERAALRTALQKARNEVVDVPCIVNGEEIRSGEQKTQVCPSDHQHTLCTYYNADTETIQKAIKASMDAKKMWESMPLEDRLAIFTKASWLLSKEYRYELLAATMLGTGKTIWQAEIDAAWELIDFWRFGAKFVEEMYKLQPTENDDGNWNRVEYRPLEGFTLAISPFNFAAIGGNLCSTPAMAGNTVVWKPSSTAILSNYRIYQILEKSGLPPGVINFLPSKGTMISDYVVKDTNLGAINFTGSTEVFRDIWNVIGTNIHKYKSYPRIVGETGGKNFHFLHSSCDLETVVNGTLRGAFEYQGQKCSATSRLYCPKSLWNKFSIRLCEEINNIKMDQPDNFNSFMTAVIDKASFNNIKTYIDNAKNDKSCKIIAGGNYDDSKGYFVEPTVIQTTDPNYITMKEEIFGPVLTCFVYDDNKYEETLKLCDETSDYALTGSIFAQDRHAVVTGTNILRQSAGNFYVNDKSTGSVVGQQPFGGARASGTNDKAGFHSIFLRFVSMRSIKENFLPLHGWTYPSVSPDN